MFSMKRMLSLTLILLVLCSYAFADPIGFGAPKDAEVVTGTEG